jgi:hypothetical protein
MGGGWLTISLHSIQGTVNLNWPSRNSPFVRGAAKSLIGFLCWRFLERD